MKWMMDDDVGGWITSTQIWIGRADGLTVDCLSVCLCQLLTSFEFTPESSRSCDSKTATSRFVLWTSHAGVSHLLGGVEVASTIFCHRRGRTVNVVHLSGSFLFGKFTRALDFLLYGLTKFEEREYRLEQTFPSPVVVLLLRFLFECQHISRIFSPFFHHVIHDHDRNTKR